MSKRFIVYIVVLLGILITFLYVLKPKWTPFYCGQYSGTGSYAWGGMASVCERAGCAVKKTSEIPGLPNSFDTEGYKFRCVRK